MRKALLFVLVCCILRPFALHTHVFCACVCMCGCVCMCMCVCMCPCGCVCVCVCVLCIRVAKVCTQASMHELPEASMIQSFLIIVASSRPPPSPFFPFFLFPFFLPFHHTHTHTDTHGLVHSLCIDCLLSALVQWSLHNLQPNLLFNHFPF